MTKEGWRRKKTKNTLFHLFLDNAEGQVSQHNTMHTHKLAYKSHNSLQNERVDPPVRNEFGVGQSKRLSEQDFKFVRRYVGFYYKGVQSAGAAVAWQVDTHKTSLLSQLIVNWGLTTISYPLLAVLVFLAVKDEDYSVSSIEDGKAKDTKMAAPSSLH